MVEPFIAAFRESCARGTFLKCTLSRPTEEVSAGLKNIYLRPVSLKKGLRIAFTYRYATRDEVKNFTVEEAEAQLQHLLGKQFRNADLFSTDRDYSWALAHPERPPVWRSKPAANRQAPDLRHDREKKRWISPTAPWLRELGIANQAGQILPSAQDKWKQINKYVEVVESLLRAHPLPADAHIVDMGSGKGYLTFALYDFLLNHHQLSPTVVGVEQRPTLVALCQKVAEEVGFSGLHFVAQDIAEYQPHRIDMLVALHACDTATDLAIATGIRHRASIILTAPCCHKQIRQQMAAQNELAPLLRHGILEERQAEIVTDGIRALLLEANGYRANVFEFISTEHTAKNVMIAAVAAPHTTIQQRHAALEQVARIKASFGLKEHYLEVLLPLIPKGRSGSPLSSD